MCVFATLNAQAQITYSSAAFPVAGDSLFVSVDNMPSLNLIQITPPGPNQNWNFASLQSPGYSATAVLNASQGSAYAQFPSADLVLTNAGSESYLKNSTNLQEIIGIKGDDPLGLNILTAYPFSNPITYRKAPLAYNHTYTDTWVFKVTVAFSDIPFPDSLELPVTPDSIRIGTHTAVSAKVDAWGKMTTPAGSFDVLRVKETNVAQRTIEGKIPFLGWVDISGLIPDSLGSIPLQDTSTSYTFWSNAAKEPIAQLFVRNDTLRSVSFKARRDGTTSVVNIQKKDSYNFVAYPNPVIDKVRIDINGYKSGNYSIRIYNLVGQKVFDEKIRVIGTDTNTLRFSLGHLKKGAYLYSLVDHKGKTLSTKRLLVVAP